MPRPYARSACPTCGLPGIPLLFGLPMPETREAAASGKIALAGCIVPEDPPNWACTAEHQWRDASDLDGWDARLLRILEEHGYED